MRKSGSGVSQQYWWIWWCGWHVERSLLLLCRWNNIRVWICRDKRKAESVPILRGPLDSGNSFCYLDRKRNRRTQQNNVRTYHENPRPVVSIMSKEATLKSKPDIFIYRNHRATQQNDGGYIIRGRTHAWQTVLELLFFMPYKRRSTNLFTFVPFKRPILRVSISLVGLVPSFLVTSLFRYYWYIVHT